VDSEQKICVKSTAELNDEFQQVFENLEPTPAAPVRSSLRKTRRSATAYADILMGEGQVLDTMPLEREHLNLAGCAKKIVLPVERFKTAVVDALSSDDLSTMVGDGSVSEAVSVAQQTPRISSQAWAATS
jgi:hypothetical protein